ncbi:MAG: hypothetical protein P4L87_19695 [Formivibrio sp.]|nr:hypothetical protein [Formivibrio sp.]
MPDLSEEELKKIIREDAMRNHDKHFNATLKAYETVIGFSVPAMRAPGIINAGAFAAILAFLSQLDSSQHADAKQLSETLFYFICGVALSSLAHGFAYLAQLSFHYSIASYEYRFTYPYVNKKGKMPDRMQVIGVIFQVITIVTVLLSYVSFCIGASQAYRDLLSIYSR